MASRKEEKERRKQERLEAEAREAAVSRRRRLLYGAGMGGALVAAAVVVVVLVVVVDVGGGSGGGGSSEQGLKLDEREGTAPPVARATADLEKAAKAAKCVVEDPEEEGNTHLSEDQPAPKYKTSPPTSGNHDPVWTEDGAYLETPPARNFVHAMEHGRVEVQYSLELTEARQLKLKGLYDEDPSHLLLFPNSKMPYEVAAAAWTHLLGCKTYNEKVFDAIRAFKDAYRDRGPEFVP